MVKLAINPSLAWKAGLMPTPERTTAVLAMTEPEITELVNAHFKLEDTETDLKSAVIRDYHTAAIWFAREQKLSLQEASAAVQLQTELLEAVQNDRASLSSAVAGFKATMKVHVADHDQHDKAEDLKQWKGKVFDFQPRCAQALVEFISTGLFQHYRMYTQLFHGVRPVNDILTPLAITVPAAPVRLDEARSVTERLQLEAEAELKALKLPEHIAPPTELAPDEIEARTIDAVKAVLISELESGDRPDATGDAEYRDEMEQLSADLAAQLLAKQ